MLQNPNTVDDNFHDCREDFLLKMRRKSTKKRQTKKSTTWISTKTSETKNLLVTLSLSLIFQMVLIITVELGDHAKLIV